MVSKAGVCKIHAQQSHRQRAAMMAVPGAAPAACRVQGWRSSRVQCRAPHLGGLLALKEGAGAVGGGRQLRAVAAQGAGQQVGERQVAHDVMVRHRDAARGLVRHVHLFKRTSAASGQPVVPLQQRHAPVLPAPSPEGTKPDSHSGSLQRHYRVNTLCPCEVCIQHWEPNFSASRKLYALY